MSRRLLLIPFLILMAVGCSALTTKELTQIPSYIIAADIRNDTVAGVTPEIEQAIINNYLPEKKHVNPIGWNSWKFL